MSLFEKLKSAGLWQTLKVVIDAIVQFGYMAIMARLLTKSDFGLMALTMSFIGFGVIFSEGGMGVALIQKQNITQRHMNAAFQSSLFIGSVIFLILFILSPFIAGYFQQPELALIIKIAGINVILSAISSVSSSLLQKHFRFKLITAFSTVTTITAYSLGIAFAYKGYGVWSLIIATITNTVLSSIIMFYLAPIKISFKLYWNEWKELFSFSSGVIILKIINYLSGPGLNLVLGKIFPPAGLGVFERTDRIKSMPSAYIGNVLDTIMFPTMAEIQDKNERLFFTYQYSLGLVNSILMPVAVFLIFFSKEVVLILLGNQWIEAIIPLQIMFTVLPFSSSGRIADSVVRAKGLIFKNVYRKGLFSLVLIISVSFGAYFYGLIGAAIGVTFSYFFNYGLMLILVKSIFRKSIKEIFMKPIKSGITISLIVLPLIIFSKYVVNIISYTPFLYILLNFIIVGSILLLFLWRFPSLAGEYILNIIQRLNPNIIKKKL